MDDQKRIEGIISETAMDGIVVNFSDTKTKFPITSSNYKKGDKVYLRLFSEEEEKSAKEEIAKAVLNEVLNGGEKEEKVGF